MRDAVSLLHAAAIVCYTSSGHTSLRAAQERPESPVLSLTPVVSVARRLALVWGIHSVQIAGVTDVNEMTDVACEAARREGFADHRFGDGVNLFGVQQQVVAHEQPGDVRRRH